MWTALGVVVVIVCFIIWWQLAGEYDFDIDTRRTIDIENEKKKKEEDTK